ncbi:MAG: YdhR family protein [Leptolyngbya sp.]|nr:YdhR family protein [Leptolyngbya sp.]
MFRQSLTISMAKLLHLTFHHPNATSAAAQAAAWERAHAIAQWPGLVWKLWIADPDQTRYGGVYLFADEASAHGYLNGPIVAGIRDLPGVSDFTAQLFDINAPLSALTRGPLPPT